MNGNKSIDGLSTRDAKKSLGIAARPKSKTVKPVTKASTKKPTAENPPAAKQSRTIKVDDKTKTKAKAKAKTKSIAITEVDSTATETILEPSSEHDLSETLDLTASSEEFTDSPLSREAAIEDFLAPATTFDFDMKSGELTKSTKKPSTMKSTDTKSDLGPKKPQKDKKKPGKVRRIISIILLVIVIAAIGLVCWGVFWGNDIIAKITGGQGTVLDALTFINENYDPLKTDENGRTNILTFGTSGYDMSGDEGDGIHDGAQLTDSIMVISLDQNTGDIAMISLPRDLKASPTCTATGKINEVYWCNNMYGDDEAAGAEALMAEVGDILGIDFQYYAHINWGSLIAIVDTLGGITVTLDEDVDDEGWTGAFYEAGVPYTINGEEALGLARARHGTSGGDFSRGASQQKILIGIKDKIFEKELTIADILGLASALGDNLRTNFTLPEMKTLAHLTSSFDFDSMRQISLLDYDNDIRLMTTGMIDEISYVLPSAGVGNYDDIQEYINIKLSNDPRVYEEPSILVLNASDEPGVASAERTKLLSEGYTNVDADNAPESDYPTGTSLYVVNRKPGTLTLLEDYYNRYAESADPLPADIPRYYDFIIILNPEGI